MTDIPGITGHKNHSRSTPTAPTHTINGAIKPLLVGHGGAALAFNGLSIAFVSDKSTGGASKRLLNDV